ncbi:MAG: hypothetical protein ACR2P2_07475 [Nakamurella sp.]
MHTVTKYEILSVLPDGNYDVQALRGSWDYDVEMMDRGVDLRVIYPAQAARRPEVMEYLSQFAARGARVRVLGSAPNRLVVSDRVRAIVPESPEAPTGRALLVTGKVLVRALYSEFLGLWRASLPVGFSTGGLDVEMVRETLVALSKGQTDEAAARQNGWALRTYRRRVAAVMDLLGTTSRFEAGALAREQGWI